MKAIFLSLCLLSCCSSCEVSSPAQTCRAGWLGISAHSPLWRQGYRAGWLTPLVAPVRAATSPEYRAGWRVGRDDRLGGKPYNPFQVCQ